MITVFILLRIFATEEIYTIQYNKQEDFLKEEQLNALNK